jgi:FMN phosphatase YigB (HAD superfamily)
MKLVFFDADDTLWGGVQEAYNESKDGFAEFISNKTGADKVYILELFEKEDHDLRKEFAFSRHRFPRAAANTLIMIANERNIVITPNDILDVYNIADAVYNFTPELKPGVLSTISMLNRSGYTVKILTLGDPIIQSSKIYRSGIHEYIKDVIIVPKKDVDTYLDIGGKYSEYKPIVMIGDSIGNDINPSLAAGWYAIHIPSDETWGNTQIAEHEQGKLFTVDNIKGVIDVLGNIFEGSERV